MKNSGTLNLNKFGWIFLIVIFLLTAIGCQNGLRKSDVGDEKDKVTLRFLNTPWPPDAISYLAQEKGFFKKHGVNAKLSWADGYEESFAQFEMGELDILNTTLLDAINYHAKTGVGEVIYIQDVSIGADAVVTFSPEIKTLNDLVGKKIGVEQGTVGEFFLNILLERQGLSLDHLDIVDVASEKVLDHLKEGVIEAGVCFEPCPTDVVNSGGFIVADSSKERNSIIDVYVARKEHVNAHKEAYVKAFAAIAEAGEYFNANPEESAAIMKEILNIPEEDILTAFQGIRIPSYSESKAIFDRSFGFTSLYNLAKLASQYLEQQGLIEETFDPDQMINSELIEAIQL